MCIERRVAPFVSVQLYFLRGSALDPVGKEGLCYLTSQLLSRGTLRHDREAFAEEVEVQGASFDVGVSRDAVGIEVTALSRTLPEVFALLGDALSRPAFRAEELERLRSQTIAELRERRDNDEALAGHIFYQILMAPDRRSRPVQGTPESLARITLDDIRACYERTFTQANLIGGAAGAIGERELRKRLMGALELPVGELLAAPAYEARDPGSIRVVLIDKPERTQSQIYLGHRAITAGDPRFFPMVLANTIYGGVFTARLSHEIREKRGWSYGAYSYLVLGRGSGSFVAHFYPQARDTVPALELALHLQRVLIESGVTQEEVDFARSYLIGSFPFRMETAVKRLDEELRLRMLGLPRSRLDAYEHSVRSVLKSQVNEAIRSVVKHDDLTVLMVCSADEIRDSVAALPGVGEVIVHPFDREWTPVG